MVETTPQICILGGGFGGLFTALHLSRCRWPQSTAPQITLIDQREHFLFTPLLYELVTEEMQPWEIAPDFRKLLAHTNVRFRQETIQGIDFQKRQVQLQDREEVIAYNRLVLAVGRRTWLDGVPGAATYACSFRTLTDVQRLQERLRSLEASNRAPIRVAIAGGGPSGVELACKLADRLQKRGQLCLIDQGEQILKDFSLSSREAVQRALTTRGVQVELKVSIRAVNSDSVTLVRRGQTETIPVDLVLWTIGTQAWEWMHTLTCQHNRQGQLLTLPTLQLLDYPEVFALGDLAAIADAQGQQVPATAQAAWQQGKVAAWNLRASMMGRPMLCFRYQHLGEMLALGKNAAVVSSFGICLEGRLAFAVRQWAYLLRMPTLSHRLRVGRHWLAILVWGRLTRCQQRIEGFIFRLLPGGGRRPGPTNYRRQTHRSLYWQRSSSEVAARKDGRDYD